MIVLAVDPGSERSAWVLFDGQDVFGHGITDNEDLAYGFEDMSPAPDAVVFEKIASYGMPVGAEVFATCFWTGRLFQQALPHCHCHMLYRRDVKLHLCGQPRAKDANIRQALLDRFGGRQAAVGTRKQPGPLFGIKADEWQALGLAVTFLETV